mmetsp:Transcript_19421/g.52256  ORF Transcript_19421/g.52256 Transcript_19421/m.52256 type:complete len:142 (-) Transcript_19421:665-1090(-)
MSLCALALACLSLVPRIEPVHRRAQPVLLRTADDRAVNTHAESSAFRPSLTLYTKANCPLCEGLEANLEDLREHLDFTLSKRWIEDNDEWMELFKYEVPVLLGSTPSGGEVEIPRPSPRSSGVFLMRWLRKHYFDKLTADA